MSKAWTIEDIERQSQRGGVNRQEVLFLIGRIHTLEAVLDDTANAIIRHRDVWSNTTSRDDPRRDDANDVLWSLVDGDDGAEEEWQS